MRYLITTAVGSVFCFISYSQNSLPGFEVGAGLSAMVYQGDLAPARVGSYRTLRPGIAISGSRLFNPFLSIRASLAFGGLRGDDAKFKTPEWRTERNFAFSSTVAEVSVAGVYNILGTNGDNSDRRLSPYVFGGMGFSFMKTAVDFTGFNAAYFGAESWVVSGLATDIAHGPSRGLLVFPVGAGVRYPISNSFSISLETNYRISFSDYIDGFSRSAGPSKKDSYYSHTASLIYTFNSGKGIKCPVIRP